MRYRLLIGCLLVSALTVQGDSWSLPEPKTFYSADGQWRLTVTPKQLKGQLEYFTDKVAGTADAGAAEGVSANEPRGELYRKSGGGTWQRVVRWRLVNEVAPVSALVANDGTIATFDNWHSMGYGDDVVVIYRSDGSLIRKLGLADFLEEEDIFQLRRSVSSIWWSGTHRVDEEKRLLVLEINAQKLETVPMSLDTGVVLVPKRAMFPRPRVTWSAEDIGTATCDGEVALLATELTSRALAADPPEYPSVARKARVAGTVVVDILIDPSGSVERAKVVKPLPFGLDQAAHDAVVKWRFRPIERGGQAARMCGRVSVKYDLASTPTRQ
jgi:TonB family protein